VLPCGSVLEASTSCYISSSKAIATQSLFHLQQASHTIRYQVFVFLYELPYHSCPCSSVPARRLSDIRCQVETPRSSFVYPLSSGAWTASQKSEGRGLAVSNSIGRESPRKVRETNGRSQDPSTNQIYSITCLLYRP
jgi:hypothetical protein